MSQTVVICGPNIDFKHGATFEVHTLNCADLKRGKCREEDYPMVITADSREEIAHWTYQDQIAEGMDPDSAISDFHFAPCVHLQ